jgi:hypothetical protein
VEKSDLGYLNAYQRKKKSGYLREREKLRQFAVHTCRSIAVALLHQKEERRGD